MFVKLHTGYGLRISGRNRLIRPGETAELPEDEARELISRELAEPCDAPPAWAEPEQEENPAAGESPALEDMTVAQLKAMALDLGLDVSDCRRKQDLIDRIAGEDGVEDGEEPPELGAEAPVL